MLTVWIPLFQFEVGSLIRKAVSLSCGLGLMVMKQKVVNVAVNLQEGKVLDSVFEHKLEFRKFSQNWFDESS